MSRMTAVVMGLAIGLSLACGGGGSAPSTVATPAATSSAAGAPAARENTPWDQKSTLTCTGLNHMYLKDVTANVTFSPAIEATGGCVLILENVSITAPIALEATGGATVNGRGGTLKGSEAALTVSGAAIVTFEGVTLDGKVKKSGAGVLTEVAAGSGVPTKAADAAPAKAAETTKATTTKAVKPGKSAADVCYDKKYACQQRVKDDNFDCRHDCPSGNSAIEVPCKDACDAAYKSADRGCDDDFNRCG